MKGAINLDNAHARALGFKTEGEAYDYMDKHEPMVHEMIMITLDEMKELNKFVGLEEVLAEYLTLNGDWWDSISCPDFSAKDYYAKPLKSVQQSANTLINRMNTPNFFVLWHGKKKQRLAE